MLRIGVTGGIGCGKSTVAAYFQKHYQVPVIDADEVTRELTKPGQPALEAISEQFGAQILDVNGELNRTLLREIIFSEPAKKKQLENLLHPLVQDRIAQWVNLLQGEYCLIVVPLLFESGMDAMVDRVLVIDCEPEQQISRVVERDYFTVEQVIDIIQTQMPREQKLARADDILDNNGSVQNTISQIKQLHQQYSQLAHPSA